MSKLLFLITIPNLLISTFCYAGPNLSQVQMKLESLYGGGEKNTLELVGILGNGVLDAANELETTRYSSPQHLLTAFDDELDHHEALVQRIPRGKMYAQILRNEENAVEHYIMIFDCQSNSDCDPRRGELLKIPVPAHSLSHEQFISVLSDINGIIKKKNWVSQSVAVSFGYKKGHAQLKTEIADRLARLTKGVRDLKALAATGLLTDAEVAVVRVEMTTEIAAMERTVKREHLKITVPKKLSEFIACQSDLGT